MYEQVLHVFSPILGLTVNVFTQVVSFRLRNQLSLLNSIFMGFFSGLITVGVIDAAVCIYNNNSFYYLFGILSTNLIIYSSLGYCYFHFTGLGETARRIRLLWEIYDSEVGLTIAELLELYNAKEVLSHRIERLLNNKQVVMQSDRYLIGNSTILLMSNIIQYLKIIVVGKKSEFD